MAEEKTERRNVLGALPQGTEDVDFLSYKIQVNDPEPMNLVVTLSIPKNEEECQSVYGISLERMMFYAVRNLATKPSTAGVVESKSIVGDLTPEQAQAKLQKVWSDYRPDVKPVAKAKASAVEKKKANDHDDYLEKISQEAGRSITTLTEAFEYVQSLRSKKAR